MTKPKAAQPAITEAVVAEPPALSFEAARDELMEVVARLESGAPTLEESLTLWERGEELAAICQQWLDGARARLADKAPETADDAS